MTKRLYEENGYPTGDSRKFGHEIEVAIMPIFEKYLADKFCIRDISHEAQIVVMDVELNYMMDFFSEDAKKAIEKRKKIVEERKKEEG